jgi:hypothetical protein
LYHFTDGKDEQRKPKHHSTPKRENSNKSEVQSPEKKKKVGIVSKILKKVRKMKAATEEECVSKESQTSSGRMSKPPKRYTPHK